jgi:nuclear GTP-binding protein
MPKSGKGYTKTQPAKGTSNQIKRSHSSSQPGRKAQPLGGKDRSGDKNLRTADTIKRLKMYNNGKAIRNKEGTIVGGQFMMKDRSGDVKITAATGRVQPDRRWFGNTRVVGATEIDKFRDEMSLAKADPYSVVLARKSLPMGLLMDTANAAAAMGKAVKNGLLMNEGFDEAFTGKVGGGARKKPKIDQLLVGRAAEIEARSKKRKEIEANKDGEASAVKNELNDDDGGYGALLSIAQGSNDMYEQVNGEEGMVQWGRDSNLVAESGEGVDFRSEKKADLFLKGQSKRIWAELYKVLDCSDIVLHIIDARNVPGTKCNMISKHITKNAKHKHLIYVLNKIDLVPNWVAKRWVGILSAERPTIAFHASQTHAFGKGALISLLRQFGKLMSDKKQISVGIVGYPNVGKSSVINTLTSNPRACIVAPVPGQTKIWQYVSLMKRIFLIDCPGVVVDAANDSETDSVLKSVVRSERLENPEDFIPPILERCKREHIAACYSIPVKGDGTWTSCDDLLEKISIRCGRLKKGGDPDKHQAAISMINDFQRGKLPFYIPPPDLTDDGVGLKKAEAVGDDADELEMAPDIKDVKMMKQDLDLIGLDKGDGIKLKKGEKAKKRGEDHNSDDEISVDGDEGDYDEDSDDEDNEAPVVSVTGGWDDMK